MTKNGRATGFPRLFGTNGVRGVVNSEQMDCQFALRLGLAIGTFMKGQIMLGTDARTSHEMLKSACAAGMMATGCDVADCGIVPTPTLQYAVKVNRAAGGVVITASHNPPEFNGIKCISRDGTEMSREDEEAVERIYHEQAFSRAEWSEVGRIRPFPTAIDVYVDEILAKVNVPAIRRARLRVAADCSNGAGGLVVPRLLERLGVRYVTLNADPNGTFPGHNSEPTPDNAQELVELVRSGGFDLGFIQDGDADRAIFVDENGRYLYGDRSLAMMARYLCSQKKGRRVVTTVGSSMCVEDAVRMSGGSITYTRTGSPVVAREMMENGSIFGGEENGGLVFADFQYCRDGAMAVAKMLEMVALKGKLSRINDEIPQYHQVKRKTPCPEDKKENIMKRLALAAKGGRIDRTDGVKVFLKDGWVLVRPSGTEPLFRVFSESKSPEKAEKMADEYVKRIEKLVKA